MAQSHFIKSNKTLINPNTLQKSTNRMFLGEVTDTGQLLKKHGPFKQWYVQTHIPDTYRVVHNLGRKDYAVSVSKMTNDNVVIETSNLTDAYFDVQITKDGLPVKLPFRFSLNVMAE